MTSVIVFHVKKINRVGSFRRPTSTMKTRGYPKDGRKDLRQASVRDDYRVEISCLGHEKDALMNHQTMIMIMIVISVSHAGDNDDDGVTVLVVVM